MKVLQQKVGCSSRRGLKKRRESIVGEQIKWRIATAQSRRKTEMAKT